MASVTSLVQLAGLGALELPGGPEWGCQSLVGLFLAEIYFELNFMPLMRLYFKTVSIQPAPPLDFWPLERRHFVSASLLNRYSGRAEGL